jgi:hypothetical protein
MNTWYEAKIRYTKQLENGTFKKVLEPYLVSAMSFTDAETRIYEELGTLIKGEFKITSCKEIKYDDVVVYDDVDYWFEGKLRINIASIDSEKEKLTTIKVLVSGSEIDDAFENLKEIAKKYLTDVEIVGLSKTQIIDVFPFKETESNDEVEQIDLDKLEPTENEIAEVYFEDTE